MDNPGSLFRGFLFDKDLDLRRNMMQKKGQETIHPVLPHDSFRPLNLILPDVLVQWRLYGINQESLPDFLSHPPGK